MRRSHTGIWGALAAAVALGGLTMAGAAQEVGGVIEVCVGADRILRAIENGKSCPAGAQRFALAFATLESELKNQPTAKPQGDPAVRALEARVRQLEVELQKRSDPPSTNQPTPVKGVVGSRVTAPFIVVDRAGRPILRVDEKVPPAGAPARVLIAAGAKDNFGVRVFNAGGIMTAAFGESQDGAGLMAAYDAAGKQRAVVNGLVGRVSVRNQDESYVAHLGATEQGKGEVVVFNDSRLPVAVLTTGSIGAGMVQLTDAGGTPTVEAGTANGVGVVRTGPMGRAGGIGGLPGSFIMGKK